MSNDEFDFKPSSTRWRDRAEWVGALGGLWATRRWWKRQPYRTRQVVLGTFMLVVGISAAYLGLWDFIHTVSDCKFTGTCHLQPMHGHVPTTLWTVAP